MGLTRARDGDDGRESSSLREDQLRTDVVVYLTRGQSQYDCRSGIIIPARQNCVWHSPPSCAIKRGKHRAKNPMGKKISKECQHQHLVLIWIMWRKFFCWYLSNQMTFLRLCMYDWPRRCCSSLFVSFFIYLYTPPFYSSSKYGVNHQMLRRSSLRERDSFVIVQFHWYNLWSLEVEGTVVQSLPWAGCDFQ